MLKFVLPLVIMAQVSLAAAPKITYFACKVKEPANHGKTIDVTVKFAIQGFDLYKEKGELIQYPGSDEEAGYISVTPSEYGIGRNKQVTLMTNLNGQGGDLRLEGSQIRLFGDGAGYQFTNLVIWDADEDNEALEGYVRDFGSTYGEGEETFKQFIKCQRSDKQL